MRQYFNILININIFLIIIGLFLTNFTIPNISHNHFLNIILTYISGKTFFLYIYTICLLLFYTRGKICLFLYTSSVRRNICIFMGEGV